MTSSAKLAMKSPMPTHTPGPWRAEPDPEFGDWRVVYDDETFQDLDAWNVAKVYGACANDGASGEANARLIAAAPDMLAALKVVATDHEPGNWMDIVDAAIGKATGQNDDRTAGKPDKTSS